MGNRYREPRPHSPERLSLKSIDSVKHEDYAVEVQATFLFDPYTPDWEGELSRAVVVLSKVISDGAERAERKRERKSREEYAGILDGHNDTENGTLVAQDIIARQAAATKTFHAAIDTDEGTGVHVESCRDRGCFGCEYVAQHFHDLFDNS
jgi:hypothetical protein